MNTLVDTSVWIAHFRSANESLGRLHDRGRLFVHPWVLYELWLGAGVGATAAGALGGSAALSVVADAEVWRFVHTHRLTSSGIGWVDAQLLASAAAAGVGLWTLDDRLQHAARVVGLPRVRR